MVSLCETQAELLHPERTGCVPESNGMWQMRAHASCEEQQIVLWRQITWADIAG
jgi:hypothetical protein